MWLMWQRAVPQCGAALGLLSVTHAHMHTCPQCPTATAMAAGHGIWGRLGAFGGVWELGAFHIRRWLDMEQSNLMFLS